MSSDRYIVLLGSERDAHIAAIRDTLREQGHEPRILDGTQFPGDIKISLGDDIEDVTVGTESWGRPAAVYSRSLYLDPVGFGVDAANDMETNWRQTMMAFRERGTVLSSLPARWEALGVPIYNPPSAQRNITKPFQLALLKKAGLPVPRTLWSNDPNKVRGFCGKDGTIYKPVQGGASTRLTTEKDMTDERLEALQRAPVCFQETLPGDDIRVYVIDDKAVVALRIVTDAIDFRQNEQKIEQIELDPAVAQQCIDATRVLGLRWTGMDLKADKDGVQKILELNPSAMFLGFDSRSGSNIRLAMAQALLSHLD